MDEGYVRVQIGSRWPVDWPADGTVVHIVRKDGSLRALTPKQQAAIDYLLSHENVGYREAAKAIGTAHSVVHQAVHLVGLERVVSWRLRGDAPIEESNDG